MERQSPGFKIIKFICVTWRVYNNLIIEIPVSDARQHCPMSDHAMLEIMKYRVLLQDNTLNSIYI